MTKRREVSKRLLLQRVAFWRERLHLTDWALAVEYKHLNRDEDGQAHAEAQPEYRQAVLRFDPRALTKANLDAYVAHECTHLLVWKLAGVATTLAGTIKSKHEWIRQEEEELVTRLERIFLAML